MTREFRLMLAEQGAADPELAGCDVHRPVGVSAAEAIRTECAHLVKNYASTLIDDAWEARASGRMDIGARKEHQAIAVRHAADLVAAIPLPADPRDAEIAALRMALEDLVDASRCLLSGVGCLRGKTPEDEDWWLHERGAELELAASEERARAALAQSNGEK